MKDTNTIRFFKELSQRMYKENDLSDIVYALCESNLQFKQFFLDFFFKDYGLIATNATLEREIQYSGGSRPDFVVRHVADGKEKVFFVENKIWDRSHHFDQYVKILGQEQADRLGYISNYTINEQELAPADQKVFKSIKDKRIKTWREFREALAAKADDVNEQSWATSEDVQGFLAYCEEICPDNQEIVSEFKLEEDAFSKVRSFYECLKVMLSHTIEIADKKIKLELWNRGSFNKPSEWIGCYFGAENLLSQKVWGWIGFYLHENTRTPGLCVEFLNKTGWGKPVFDEIKERGYQVDYCFDISDCLDKNEDEIKAIIKESLEKSLQWVHEKTKPSPVNGYFKTPAEIRAMRRLPLFLQQQVMNGIKIENGRVEIVEASDSSKPNGWCGIYFEVVSAQTCDTGKNCDEQVKEMRERGWLGTYFDDRKIKTDRGEKVANGNWMALEYKGKSYYISDAGKLDYGKMASSLSQIIKLV